LNQTHPWTLFFRNGSLKYEVSFEFHFWFRPLFEENCHLVTNEPVEFEKQLVAVGDFRRITHHFRGIYSIYLKRMKAKPDNVNM
jgi:hypothetical protein